MRSGSAACRNEGAGANQPWGKPSASDSRDSAILRWESAVCGEIAFRQCRDVIIIIISSSSSSSSIMISLVCV